MIRHIIRLIWNQRRQNAWLWVELLLVSVFLWFIVDYLYVLGVTYASPLGFDIDHTYRVVIHERSPASSGFIPEDQREHSNGQDFLTVLDRIRAYPSIEAVSVSDCGMPYARGARSMTFRVDTFSKSCGWTYVTPEFFEVFRLTDKNGSSTALAEAFRQENSVLLSRDVAEKIPGGPVVGKKAYFMNGDSLGNTICAVFEPIRRHQFSGPRPYYYRPLRLKEVADGFYDGSLSQLEVCVRVRPDADLDFPSRFRKEMTTQIGLRNLYLMDVQPMSYLRDAYIQSTGVRNEIKTRVSVAFFLLANIFLGIIGTFWFRTEYRKGEMGLRMALGSPRSQLSSIMISEGVLLLLFACIPAIAVCLNIAYMDMVDTYLLPFTWGRFLVCQGITFFLIVSMIVAGVWYPARQTSRLEPAEALRYE